MLLAVVMITNATFAQENKYIKMAKDAQIAFEAEVPIPEFGLSDAEMELIIPKTSLGIILFSEDYITLPDGSVIELFNDENMSFYISETGETILCHKAKKFTDNEGNASIINLYTGEFSEYVNGDILYMCCSCNNPACDMEWCDPYPYSNCPSCGSCNSTDILQYSCEGGCFLLLPI